MDTIQQRESMEYDVVIVGAGPSGLSTAIKLKQINPEINVCIVEKASEVGAHILSGNVFETRALDELLPDWKTLDGCPLKTKVTKKSFYFFLKSLTLLFPRFYYHLFNTIKETTLLALRICADGLDKSLKT